ncbi:LysM peptidoglycan-binding domain-containing protein [Lamprobacter sp.]|uniref:LysM peptidoglycan-binding domain-containing protein n=1 Tax=Lamprobacter sp. TaxID=3100796 RepID=UPI003A4D26A8
MVMLGSSIGRSRCWLMVGLISWAAWPALCAAEVALQPDAPQIYRVRSGDSLWGIAGRFLRDPWRWPEVWEGNPEVSDPNLIFPGEQLVLDTRRVGAPRIRSSASGLRVVKLSPRVRVTELDAAIPTIPVGTIAPFLSRPWVADSRELDDAPYVVGFPRERILVGAGDRIFVRQIMTARDARFEVLRPGEALRDAVTNELLGYQALYVGEAALEQTGDPATLLVTHSRMQVQIGDRLRPARDEAAVRHFQPRSAPPGLEGQIISVLDGVSQIGQFDVVVLDRGSREGVEIGQVFAVYRGGTEARDRVMSARNDQHWRDESPLKSSFWMGDWQIRGWESDRPDPNAPLPLHRKAERLSETYIVPQSRSGILMVFRVFARVSFALVMRANQAMHLGAIVATPDGH